MSENETKSSLGVLLSRFSSQISTLFRAEIALTKAQAKESGKRFALAGALLIAAAVFGLFTLGWLLVALFFMLNSFTGSALVAALLTATVLLVAAVISGIAGLAAINTAKKDIPNPAAGVKTDVSTIKSAFKNSAQGVK